MRFTSLIVRIAGQHAPTPLENGNILIFDNGVHRLDDPLPFSRVIEVNPATNEIGWTYQDRPVSNFFSPRMGNAQRLPNGNTLINEASFGPFSRSPERAKLFGNTSIPTLVDRRMQRRTQSFGRFVTARRKSPRAKPWRELEYLRALLQAGKFKSETALSRWRQ